MIWEQTNGSRRNDVSSKLNLFATIGYLDEDGKQNVRRVFRVWHKGLGKHLIEFLSEKHPLQTSNS